MPAGVPSTQFPKEERHDVKETFANSLSQCFFDGQTLRLEFARSAWTRRNRHPPSPSASGTWSRESC